MGADRHRTIAERVMATWTAQDVDAVLACYTPDLVYLDPNTRGPIRGHAAMRAYLSKLFSRWTMSWTAGEILPLEGVDGVVIRWSATLSLAGNERAVAIEGVDLVVLDGDLIARNEVWYDRAPLAALLSSVA